MLLTWISIWPEVGDSSPAIIRSVVVLPQPEGPRMVVSVPRSTSKLMPLTTSGADGSPGCLTIGPRLGSCHRRRPDQEDECADEAVEHSDPSFPFAATRRCQSARPVSPSAFDSAGRERRRRGSYIDVAFRADDPAKLWASVRQELFASVGLAESAIVVCEGQQGWDDYLLLHHYDSAVPLDDLG